MKHFKSIDALRGWMAWWVVCQHLIQISGYDVTYRSVFMTAATAGGAAVTVFIMISGYVITHLMISRYEDYRSYLVRRFMRLFPLLLAAVVISVLTRDLYFSAIVERPWRPDEFKLVRFAAERDNLGLYIALHLSMLHGLVPSWVLPYSSTAILPPAWSLSLEWQFYIVAPLLFAALFRRSLALNVGVCLVVITILVFGATELYDGWPEPSFLPMSIGYFMVGILTRIAADRSPLVLFIAPTLLIGVNMVITVNTNLGGHALLAPLPFIVWTALVIAILAESGRLSSQSSLFVSAIINNRFTRFLGECSYSTYLLHIPVFVIALSIAHTVGMPKTPLTYLATMLAALVPLALLSRASYKYIECPGMSAAKWVLKTSPHRQSPAQTG